MFPFRSYQEEILRDHATGILILHWSRQIGKTTTLAAWAVQRIFSRPHHTVTVLSNSLKNGADFMGRAVRFCDFFQQSPPNLRFRTSRYEIQVPHFNGLSRMLAVAANPRTARGFSGDLILDEFAFYEDSEGVWEAAEPILSSHPDFLCRIASTGNGRQNLFYRMTHDLRFGLSRISRTDAWQMGVPILDPLTRQPITPAEARAAAVDKDAYDQNYECAFCGEIQSLLQQALIQAAADAAAGLICKDDWSPESLRWLEKSAESGYPLFAGVDVGRRRDRTVIAVLQSEANLWKVRALLRLEKMRLPDQQKRLATLLRLPRVACICIDMTGLGLGLYEYTQQVFGVRRVKGINFSSSVPVQPGSPRLWRPSSSVSTAPKPSVRITESMAMHLVSLYEEGKIRHPLDEILREDLLLLRREVTPMGQVRIAAGRDESGLAGHADHFWSLALALEAARQGVKPHGKIETIRRPLNRRMIL